MIHDGANNLDISYNHLNLIEKVEQNGSTLANYSYLADGTKLSATDADGDGLYYFGSLVYRKQNGAFEIESARSTAEGFSLLPMGSKPGITSRTIWEACVSLSMTTER